MDKEIKRESARQYMRYFRLWFVAVGILAVICVVAGILHMTRSRGGRGNLTDSVQRVFDYGEVLSPEEESSLQDYIDGCQEKYGIDIVLVTIREDVESLGDWEDVMMNYADDFYDQGDYGYDKVHGDGFLLLDNWYEDADGSQKGNWLSTCGRVYRLFGMGDIDYVLDQVDKRVDISPYEGYQNGIKAACARLAAREKNPIVLPWSAVLLLPLVAAGIYAGVHLRKTPARDTTTATTYLAGRDPVFKRREDEFLYKNVVSRRIETSSSGGGGGRSGGGGGHVSSGGVSHGGGGHRR